MNDIWSKAREEFPVTKNWVYLNHAGVSPIPSRTASAIERYTKEVTSQGACIYEEWMKRVEEVRRSFAKIIGADSKEVAFVKNTSHGLSIVANGIPWKKGDNIITVYGEFPSNIYPWMNLQKQGVELRTVTPKEGRVLPEEIEKLMDENTRLLTISSVEFGTGFRNDLDALGLICKEKGILFCVDAIQSLGLIPMDVKKWNIDFLAADGHKWLVAPEGLGCFYCSMEKLESLELPLLGWNSVVNATDFSNYDFTLKKDAQRFEEGTLNIMGIMALGASLELLQEIGIDRIEQRVLGLTEQIISELLQKGYKVRSPRGEGERSGIVSFESKKSSDAIQRLLMKQGIACASRDGALRVSPHFYNTEEEIQVFMKKLVDLDEA